MGLSCKQQTILYVEEASSKALAADSVLGVTETVDVTDLPCSDEPSLPSRGRCQQTCR